MDLMKRWMLVVMLALVTMTGGCASNAPAEEPMVVPLEGCPAPHLPNRPEGIPESYLPTWAPARTSPQAQLRWTEPAQEQSVAVLSQLQQVVRNLSNARRELAMWKSQDDSVREKVSEVRKWEQGVEELIAIRDELQRVLGLQEDKGPRPYPTASRK